MENLRGPDRLRIGRAVRREVIEGSMRDPEGRLWLDGHTANFELVFIGQGYGYSGPPLFQGAILPLALTAGYAEEAQIEDLMRESVTMHCRARSGHREPAPPVSVTHGWEYLTREGEYSFWDGDDEKDE